MPPRGPASLTADHCSWTVDGRGGQAERGGERKGDGWAGELSVVQALHAFLCHSRSDTSGTVLDEGEWREEPGERVLLKA